MFIRKRWKLLAIAAAGGGLLATIGCGGSPDPAEFGEVITEVPPALNRPFPLPELKAVEGTEPHDHGTHEHEHHGPDHESHEKNVAAPPAKAE